MGDYLRNGARSVPSDEFLLDLLSGKIVAFVKLYVGVVL